VLTTERQPVAQGALSGEDLEFLRERLLEERAKLIELYRKDLRAGQKSVEEASEDLVDRANFAYNRELTFSLSDAERTQLRLIEEALDRMKKGAYGICQHSGKPIELPRLRAVPWARYRVEVQEKIEQGLLSEGD
jgi:RNA polymerase-binding transcription factor